MEELPLDLINGGDCHRHFHSDDRTPTHDTLARLQQLNTQVSPSSAYAVRASDDIIQIRAGVPVTMPLSAGNGREYEVVALDDVPFLISLTSPDTIFGETSVLVEVAGTALRFKAITGGWIFI